MQVDVHWTTLGIFLTGFIVAAFTVVATLVNYQFFRSQTDPDVIVYTTVDEKSPFPAVILLVIENIGKGFAKDVTFTFPKDSIPGWAPGLDERDAPIADPMSSGPLVTGIPALGPGAKRRMRWGQYGGLKKWLGDTVVNIKVHYRSNRDFGWLLGPKIYESICPIEVKSFLRTSTEKNWDHEHAIELKRIADLLSSVGSGTASFNVEITKAANDIEPEESANVEGAGQFITE